MDPADFTILFENLSEETITFISRHPKRDDQPVDWLTISCPSGKVVLLPHRRYMTPTETVIGRFVRNFAEQAMICDSDPSKVAFRAPRKRVFDDAQA
jgi:hypothetical protein